MQTLQLQLEDDIFQDLRQQATLQATSIENLARNALANYLKMSNVDNKSNNYSFIGIGRSGKGNLSTQVDDILDKSMDRREGWSLSK